MSNRQTPPTEGEYPGWEEDAAKERQTPPGPVPFWAKEKASPNMQGRFPRPGVAPGQSALGPSHLLIPTRFRPNVPLDGSRVRDVRGGQSPLDVLGSNAHAYVGTAMNRLGQLFGNRDRFTEGQAALQRMGGPENRERVQAALRASATRLNAQPGRSRGGAFAPTHINGQPIMGGPLTPNPGGLIRGAIDIGRRHLFPPRNIPKSANPVGPVALNPSVTTASSVGAYHRAASAGGGTASPVTQPKPVKPKKTKKRSGGGARLM